MIRTPGTLVMLACVNCVAAADVCQSPSAAISDQLIVGSIAGVTPSDLATLLESYAPGLELTPEDAIAQRPIHLLHASWPVGWTLLEIEGWIDAMTVQGHPSVAWLELDYTQQIPGGGTGSIFVDLLPDFDDFLDQYSGHLIGSTAAHARADGTGTVVAVVDTGLDASHPMLADRVAAGGFDFVTRSPDFSDRADGSDSDGDGIANELVGHGTFVSTIVRLAAPGAKILPIRVLDSDGNGRLWTLARGLYHAIDRGVEVINASVVSTYDSTAVETALGEASLVGIVVVASAGNCSGTERLFPAAKSDVLGVAATDHLDRKGAFSNFGGDIDLAAPGSSVQGGVPSPVTAILGGRPLDSLSSAQGTSFAAPLVAGVAALVRSQHPQWPCNETTAIAVSDVVLASCASLVTSDPVYGTQLGAGRLDALAAVMAGPPMPRLGDLNADGLIDGVDLAAVLSAWGATHSPADLNGDGIVSAMDLSYLFADWG